ncbi:hypothetical protein [Rheinheimera sp. NSM]|uniref:hypothetical protein n=1 Tax=Rheinheimera sp. NSM TaxID=3457884 RepID=UPI004035978C
MNCSIKIRYVNLRDSTFMLYRQLLISFFFILLFLSLTDFFIFISPAIFLLVFLSVIFVMFFRIAGVGGYADVFILSYVLLSLVFFSVNYIFDAGFNMVVFVPMIAFCFVFSFQSFSVKELSSAVRFIAILILMVSFIELMVKLNVLSISIYKDFIENYGDKRPDVLRVRTLFGSSLSTAALTIFLSFYFLFVQRSYFYLFLVLIIIILSGSRTGFVLFSFLSFSALFLNKKMFLYTLKIKLTYFFVLFLAFSFLLLAVYFAFEAGIGHIVSRTFSVKVDDSFSGREDTTAATFYRLFDELPGSLVFGVDSSFISDSAFVSIAAVSGIIAVLMYVMVFLYCLALSRLSGAVIFVYSIVFFLGGAVIGDFLIPPVSLLYFVTFLVLSNQKGIENNESRSCYSIT